MASPNIELCEALVDLLRAPLSPYSQDFDPIRIYTLSDTASDTLEVFVAPTSFASTHGTRSKMLNRLGADVIVRKNIPEDEFGTVLEHADELMTLVKEIIDSVQKIPLELEQAQLTAKWIETELDPLYDGEQLRKSKVFLSSISFFYEVYE